MVLETMTWACLFLAAGAAPADVWHMNTNKFQIPIRIQASRRNEIKELQLYVSRDQGGTWELVAKATPDKENFEYYAAGDGQYWFSVAVVDQKNQLDPPNIMKAPVGQKIQIDTKKPEVRIASADRQAEEIVVQWDARDEYLDANTLKIDYRTADSPAGLWAPVAQTAPSAAGRVAFRPNSMNPVSVRVQVQDQAGNVGQAQAEVAGLGGATGPTPVMPPTPSTAVGPAGPTPVVSNWNNTASNLPMPVQPVRAPDPLDTPPAFNPVPIGSPAPRAPIPANSGAGLLGDTGAGVRSPVLAQSSPMPVAGSDLIGASRTTSASRTTLPDLKIVNKRQVNLDFEVAKFGPSGLGAVDVYVTADEGQTWEKQASDGAVNLPPGADRAGGPVRGSVPVLLAREGMAYGFTLVVKSRAGLGKAPPQRGDLPQLRVELDTTLPEAELYEPQADPSRRDTLLLIWKAADRNLTGNPVSLEWAERKEGPWTFIGGPELPNTGKHSWAVPPNVPPSVFLRLTVRDTAGNTAVAQTNKPVLVDLTVPEISVVGLGTGQR